MCGLAAIFAYGPGAPPVDAASLDAMAAAMVPRGPDGAGRWCDDARRIGLAHRRLSIIDLSEAGAQPMTASDGALTIVFNGEIYNFATLRTELEAQGCTFRSQSDTEVLLQLYRRHGREMVHKLRGMFAFALWDGASRSLLLARDPFGIKPLYYADDGQTLRAASQVKALLAGGGIDTRPDPAGHVGFFVLGSVPEPHTLYAAIHALPAGCMLWTEADTPPREIRYFDLPRHLQGAAEAPQPFSADALREALADSVKAHMVADVPVGLFLSAGYDSATLAALACDVAGAPVRSLTLAFDEYAGTAHDEAPLAEAVAAHYGTEHTTARVRGRDFGAELDGVLAAMDQPSIDGVNVYFVAKAAREQGLKVALSGLGGDEMFAGYDTFRQVPRLVRALAPVPGIAAMGRVARAATAPLLGRIASPKAAGVLEYGSRYGDAWLLRRALFMPWELDGVLGSDMVRSGWQALALRDRLNEACRGLVSPRLAMTALEAGWYMRNQLLRDADWAGMAHSVEIRVPLVDAMLLRRLAPWLADRHPPLKADLAATARPPLPEALLARPKTGFSVPVRDWLQGGEDQGRGLRGWAKTVYGAFTRSTGPGPA